MTGAGFEVDDAVLARHAQQVDALSGRMRDAAGAGRPLDLAAYGIVGQVFALAAVDATAAGSASVAELAELTREFGDGVRAVREDYLRVDRDNAATFRWPR